MNNRKSIESKGRREIEITPFVKSFSTGVKIPADLDVKEAYREYLMEKYG